MGLTLDGLIVHRKYALFTDGGAYGMSTEGVIRKGQSLRWAL